MSPLHFVFFLSPLVCKRGKKKERTRASLKCRFSHDRTGKFNFPKWCWICSLRNWKKSISFFSFSSSSLLLPSSPQWARKFKKAQEKNSWNQINRNFFSWNCIFDNFKHFPSSNIDFWPFLKLQKMEFGQKNCSWNWIIRFHEFFFCLGFF